MPSISPQDTKLTPNRDPNQHPGPPKGPPERQPSTPGPQTDTQTTNNK